MRPKPMMIFGRVRRLHLEEIGFVDRLADKLVHVIGLVRAGRDQRVEAVLLPVPWVIGRTFGYTKTVILGQIVEEIAGRQQRLDIILERIVGHARFGGVRNRTAEFFLRHHFVGHGLDHIGTGDEHVGAVLHHEDEVGHCRAVNRPPRARTHDEADLRHHARCQHVALEHLGIAAKARHALLDARAAAVVNTDDRRADLHRIVHDLADFHRMRLGKRTAEDGEILAVNIKPDGH